MIEIKGKVGNSRLFSASTLREWQEGWERVAVKVGGRVVTGQMVVVAKLAGRVGNKGGSQGGQMVVGEIESVEWNPRREETSG